MATDRIELRRGQCRVVAATRGAELQEWAVAGRDLLWGGDSRWWGERSPVLFPVVGWTRGGEARVDGRVYPLGLHGFARHMPFAIAQADESACTLVLRDSPETLEQYPFSFELEVCYALDEAGVTAAFTVRNPGGRPMPYAVGIHPGFRVRKEAASLLFDAAESDRVPVIAPGGLFAAETRAAPLADGRVLPLADATFAHEALCFLGVRSRGLRLDTGCGEVLRIRWRDFPNIVAWSRPGAPFACVEAWTGAGDPDGYTGDLFAKPGMILLEPGESRSHVYEMTLVEHGSTT